MVFLTAVLSSYFEEHFGKKLLGRQLLVTPQYLTLCIFSKIFLREQGWSNIHFPLNEVNLRKEAYGFKWGRKNEKVCSLEKQFDINCFQKLTFGNSLAAVVQQKFIPLTLWINILRLVKCAYRRGNVSWNFEICTGHTPCELR